MSFTPATQYKKMQTQKEKNKIAIVIPLLRRGGGAEKNATWLTEVLATHGWSSITITFFARENEYAINGQRFNLQTVSSGPMIFRSFWRSLELIKLIEKEKIATIISFTEEAAIVCLLAKFFGWRGRLVVAVRNNPEVRNWTSRLFIRLFYRLADVIVANSRQMALILEQKFGLSKVVTINNPCFLMEIEMEKNELLPADIKEKLNEEFTFVSVGRLIEQKNQAILIKAFARVAEKYPKIKLMILGEGHWRPRLEFLVSSLNLEKQIFLLGVKDNIYPYLTQASVFVLPSLWEGFPNALLDALALNLPCVVSDCHTGPREILAPDRDLFENLSYPCFARYGILLPIISDKKETDINLLAKIMTELVEDKSLREKYSLGFERAKDFDPKHLSGEWLRVINA
jgi:glycosyltransferase involved in cell wall biosynthesis